MKKKYYIIISALLVVVIAVVLIFSLGGKKSSGFSFETAEVKRGDIYNTVSATGTLEALETVEVGTQVSGIIQRIYVDFNSIVKKGQLLARIDETPLIAQLNQSQASVDQAQAEFDYQEANFDRNQALYKKKLISQADFDQIVYSYSLSKAKLASAKAQNERNEINLKYATITSPIDGVILDRAVDEGQTVAASFNTPTLFTIANDLTQMRVETSVDEADIGLVKSGQRVEFSVDAFPESTFSGEVTEVRLQPVVTNNVVTYTVIINAPNPDYKLMPGMTATTTIYISEVKDQLIVPMQAVSFNPDQEVMFAYFSSRMKGKMPNAQGGGMGGNFRGNASSGAGGGTQGNFPARGAAGGRGFFGKDFTKVWMKDSHDSIFIRPIKVSLNDGINYVVTDGLKEGDEVIINMSKVTKADKVSDQSERRSPFMPTPPGRR